MAHYKKRASHNDDRLQVPINPKNEEKCSSYSTKSAANTVFAFTVRSPGVPVITHCASEGSECSATSARAKARAAARRTRVMASEERASGEDCSADGLLAAPFAGPQRPAHSSNARSTPPTCCTSSGACGAEDSEGTEDRMEAGRYLVGLEVRESVSQHQTLEARIRIIYV
jgi:hypothetical protein